MSTYFTDGSNLRNLIQNVFLILTVVENIQSILGTNYTSILNELILIHDDILNSINTIITNNASYQSTNVGIFNSILSDLNILNNLVTSSNSFLSTLISNLATYQTTNVGLFNTIISDLLTINTSITTTNSLLTTSNANLLTIITNTGNTATNTNNINTGVNSTNTLLTAQNTLIGTTNTDLNTIITNTGNTVTNTSNINTGVNSTNTLLTTQNTLIGTTNTDLNTIITNTGNTVSGISTSNGFLSMLVTNSNTELTDLTSVINLLTNIYNQTIFNRSLYDTIFVNTLMPYVAVDFDSGFQPGVFSYSGLNIAQNANNVAVFMNSANTFGSLLSQQTIWAGAGRTQELLFGVSYSFASCTNAQLLAGASSVHNGFQVGFDGSHSSWGFYYWYNGKTPCYVLTITTAQTTNGTFTITMPFSSGGGGPQTFTLTTSTNPSAPTAFTASIIANYPGTPYGQSVFAQNGWGTDQIDNLIYFTWLGNEVVGTNGWAASTGTPTIAPGSTGIVATFSVASQGALPNTFFVPFSSFNVNPTYAATMNLTNINTFGIKYAYNGNMVIYLTTYNNNQTVILHQLILNNVSLFPHMIFQMNGFNFTGTNQVSLYSYQFLYETSGASSGIPVQGSTRSLYTFDKTIPAANTTFPIISNRVVFQKNNRRNYINANALNMTITTTASKDVLVQLFIFPFSYGSGSNTDYPNFEFSQILGSTTTLSCLNTNTCSTISLVSPTLTTFLQNFIITAGSGVQVTFPYGLFSLIPGVAGGVCATTASTSGTVSISFEANELI